MGGVIFVYEVVWQFLEMFFDVWVIFVEKDGFGGMKLCEVFVVWFGEIFVVVEDVFIIGGSLFCVVWVVEGQGGQCIGLCCIIDCCQQIGLFLGYLLMSFKELYFDIYVFYEVFGWLVEWFL